MSHTDEYKLSKIIARHLNIKGERGGWLRDSNGKIVCQGYFAFQCLLTKIGCLIPNDRNDDYLMNRGKIEQIKNLLDTHSFRCILNLSTKGLLANKHEGDK